jgi:hypothetical protein
MAPYIQRLLPGKVGRISIREEKYVQKKNILLEACYFKFLFITVATPGTEVDSFMVPGTTQHLMRW